MLPYVLDLVFKGELEGLTVETALVLGILAGVVLVTLAISGGLKTKWIELIGLGKFQRLGFAFLGLVVIGLFVWLSCLQLQKPKTDATQPANPPRIPDQTPKQVAKDLPVADSGGSRPSINGRQRLEPRTRTSAPAVQAQAPAPPEQTVNAPNGIGAIGGTLINPTVNNYGAPRIEISDTQVDQIAAFLASSGVRWGKVIIMVDNPTQMKQLAGDQLKKALDSSKVGLDVEVQGGMNFMPEGTPIFPGISFFAIDEENKKLAIAIAQALNKSQVVGKKIEAIPSNYPDNRLEIFIRDP